MGGAGFHCDVDHFTPPGSACSFTFGIGINDDFAPGSVKGTHLVVSDLEAAVADLRGRGVDVTNVRHITPSGWQPGVDPAHRKFGSCADFADPDGNTWALQEVGHRDAQD